MLNNLNFLKSSHNHLNLFNLNLNIVLIGIILLLNSIECKKSNFVTCGSAFKLLNTAFKVRLHSHDIKYGSGSGQQSVTGTDLKEDVNSIWVVKGTAKLPCTRGEPISCGSKIRLEHLQTHRNLHSHLFSAPLSGHQEISAFGEYGEGDSGDNWELVCKSTSWSRDEPVQFRHIDTSNYLSSSGNTFGRPIQGQMEIIGMSRLDSASHWQTVEGVFIHTDENKSDKNNEKPDHNEL